MGGTPKKILSSALRPEAVAPRLVAAWEALGLKISEIADALSVDRSAWTKYEKGLRLLPVEIAFRMAERYGLSLDYIYRGRSDMLPPDLRESLASWASDPGSWHVGIAGSPTR